MLDPPRYLLGVAEILLLAGSAGLGAHSLRARLLPGWSGPPAWLATGVVALALLIWTAEVLGSFGLFAAGAYLAGVAVVGAGLWLGLGGGGGGPSRLLGFSPRASRLSPSRLCEKQDAAAREGPPPPPDATLGRNATNGDAPIAWWATAVAVAIAVVAVVHFAVDVRGKLLTGMTGFDSTWYHGPFAAGFFQSGNTWDLHFIAPQFLAWFYPANAEVFPAAGMLAFGRDVLSPLVNLGWFLGCLLALWCIGRPYRVAPWSLALGAIALSLPVLSDQAGEARNDIVGIFFLLAAVAIALKRADASGLDDGPSPGNPSRGRPFDRIAGKKSTAVGVPAISGLAAGLAAGTKLNFLLPAAVLVLGLPLLAPAGRRLRALAATVLAALAGGGYWYLRNLVHTGNPLPWFDRLGPISLPAPVQALGGREGHSVLGYLTDGGVWSGWFLPGLHHGLTILWPLLGGLALAGLALAVSAGLRRFGRAATESAAGAAEPTGRLSQSAPRPSGGGQSLDGDWVLAVAAATALAAALAWLIAPTSASGPVGMPRGFESGLRYLAPALILGLALLPATPALRKRLPGRTAAGEGGDRGEPPAADCERGARAAAGREPAGSRISGSEGAAGAGSRISRPDGTSGVGSPISRPDRRSTGMRPSPRALVAAAVVLLAIAIGYPVQRHYLRDRYADPTFAAPGLDAAFSWANSISDARIATTGTRQYPLYGRDLSNHVQYVGVHTPHGGFIAPTTCRQWRTLLDEGHYEYVVATRDRVEPGKPPYPPAARWTAGPWAEPVLSKPPTKVFKLKAPPDPSACP